MITNFKQLRVNLHPETFRKLEESLKKGTSEERTVTTVVRDALNLYFGGSVKTGVERFNELEYVTSRDIQERGLNMEDTVSIKHKDDIVPAFSTSDIRSGPGAVHRLVDIGIKPIEVIRAKRNKAAGREYNKELEQYFDLL